MNPHTLRIEEIEDRADALARGLVPISPDEEAAVRGMNRRERRAWLAKQRCKDAGLVDIVRPDGSPVPKHHVAFKTGELVVLKDQTFRVAYIGECTLLLEPTRAALVGEPRPTIAELEARLARESAR